MRKATSLCLLVGALSMPLAIEGCGRSDKTMDIISPDYILEQYRWFKKQTASIDQVKNQVKSEQEEIADMRKEYGKTPVSEWPSDEREEFRRKQSILRGYISQYNMLVGQFNARDSDVTAKFAKGQDAGQLKPYLGVSYSTIDDGAAK